ncbi:MAG TPA: DUF2892 domain-containing protein [Myxococcales bacterium]|jgi:hypothetical protein
MTLDRQVRAFAGTFVLVSLALGRYVDPRVRWFTAFVGANLLQSSFTGFCPLERLLQYVEGRRELKA